MNEVKRSEEQKREMAEGRDTRRLNEKLYTVYRRLDELEGLTDEQIKVILTLHHSGLETIDGLADAHAVSKEVIIFLTSFEEVQS